MPTLKQKRYDYLIDAGLLHAEAIELSRQYTITQLRTIPYLKTLLRSRRLFRANAQKQNMPYAAYKKAVKALHRKNREATIWDTLKKYRKKSIDEGDYIPPKHKPAPKGISKGQLSSQKFRRAERRDIGVKPDTLRKWISEMNESIKNANEQRKEELTVMRNRMQERLDKMKE